MEGRKGGRAGLLAFLGIVAGAGILCGSAAAGAAGPFAVLRPPPAPRLAAQAPREGPVDASLLFPPPKPAVITREVVVDDPPPPPPPGSAPARSSAPAATPRPAPSPTPVSDDGGGGADS